MNVDNPLYENQMISVDIVTFTIENGLVKVLLVKRKEKPYSEGWSLPGGRCYNNETMEYAASRELKEKTGLEDLYLKQFGVFSEPKRDIRFRNISIAYLALIDNNKVKVFQQTSKTLDAKWENVQSITNLAFDHNEILAKAVQNLRQEIVKSNIVKFIMPDAFTLPELQNVYEIILDKKFDRRNFRKKFLDLGLIVTTGEKKETVRYRKPNFYKFIDDIDQKETEIF
ncbi:MAG: hypothetical protein A2Y18_03985 [Clostridiales bacterium GWD2_32_19]|nr:MAG: hypothetical protein A2Y18_03985 [Clostridiales bacterium GWD2_32_19]